MKGRIPWGGPLPPPVDLIVVGRSEDGAAYCRNWQGLHVPIGVMTQEQRQAAWANRLQFQRKK